MLSLGIFIRHRGCANGVGLDSCGKAASDYHTHQFSNHTLGFTIGPDVQMNFQAQILHVCFSQERRELSCHLQTQGRLIVDALAQAFHRAMPLLTVIVFGTLPHPVDNYCCNKDRLLTYLGVCANHKSIIFIGILVDIILDIFKY